MIPRLHHANDSPKFGEVRSLLGFERVFLEEWNDVPEQVLLASYSIGHPVAVILANHSASEMCLQGVKHLHIPFVLHDGELRENLIAALHVGMRIDSYVKATFTVHEPSYPL
jgi:hypothetical protein